MGAGAQEWGGSTFGTEGDEELSADFSISAVEPIAKDLIRIFFSKDIVINDAFLDINNYSLTQTLDSLPIEIKEVVPPNKDGSVVARYVLLRTVRLREEIQYAATVTNLSSRGGGENLTSLFLWRYSRTKTDFMLASFPEVYDHRVTSNIRQLMTAVSLADNRIGGAPAPGVDDALEDS